MSSTISDAHSLNGFRNRYHEARLFGPGTVENHYLTKRDNLPRVVDPFGEDVSSKLQPRFKFASRTDADDFTIIVDSDNQNATFRICETRHILRERGLRGILGVTLCVPRA